MINISIRVNGGIALTNEERTHFTKEMLSAALKKQMKKKTLSKISVSELIKECNINRNTFYYHFTDIYDLLKWTLDKEAIEIIKGMDMLINAEEAVRFVMDYVDNNQFVASCIYDSMGYDEVKKFLGKDLIGAIRGAIEVRQRSSGLYLEEPLISFTASFYTEAVVGITIQHLKGNDTCSREETLENLMLIFYTSLDGLLKEKGVKK